MITNASLSKGLVFLLALACVFSACGCGGGKNDDDSSDDSAPDDSSDDDSAPDDSVDDDSADDSGDDADDTGDDTDDDTGDDTGDDDTYPQLPMPPDDGRLYAAAAQVVITPNEINHPGPIYLGGTGQNRIATGVHDDLLASALILATHDVHVAIVALDLVGFTRTRSRHIQEELEKHGLTGRNIFIASTHTHEGPDTLGIWGPDDFTSGASPTYAAFLEETVTTLVVQTWADLTPVTMRAGRIEIDEPASNHPGLINDYRDPFVTNPRLSAARFDSDGGQTVATLVNFHSHPECTICTREITADFPRWVRERTESNYGGKTVYVSGAVGGLSTPLGVQMPLRDEQGNPVLDGNGDPVLVGDCTWEHSRSLGFILADYAAAALANAPEVAAPALSATVEDLLLPFVNPLLILALVLGIVDWDMDDVDQDHPFFCGPFGCAKELLGVIRVGPVTIVTSPGETFAETLIGREESTINYSPPWPPFTYPAMDGYEYLLADAVPMHIGLCNDEIGYIVPRADIHPPGHPDYYCETDDIGPDTETIYREAVMNLLGREQRF